MAACTTRFHKPKKRYPSEEAAGVDAARMAMRHHFKFSTYRCPKCENWHVGGTPGDWGEGDIKNFANYIAAGIRGITFDFKTRKIAVREKQLRAYGKFQA